MSDLAEVLVCVVIGWYIWMLLSSGFGRGFVAGIAFVLALIGLS